MNTYDFVDKVEGGDNLQSGINRGIKKALEDFKAEMQNILTQNLSQVHEELATLRLEVTEKLKKIATSSSPSEKKSSSAANRVLKNSKIILTSESKQKLVGIKSNTEKWKYVYNRLPEIREYYRLKKRAQRERKRAGRQ